MSRSNLQKYKILTWVLTLGGIVGLLAVLPSLLAWIFVHPFRRLNLKSPRSLRLIFTPIQMRTEDGFRLSGWYVPASGEGDSDSAAAMSPKGVVIVCHGYTGNRQSMLPYVKFLNAGGYAVVLFDFRAHGTSGGNSTYFGQKEPLDLRAAVDWVKNEKSLRGIPLAVLGESMGAAVALITAEQDSRIDAVVADAPYADFDHAIGGRMRALFGERVGGFLRPGVQRIGERFLGIRCAEIAPIDQIAGIAPRPVLLIQGTRDWLAPELHARRLNLAAPDHSTYWEVDGAGHVCSFYVEAAEYAARVIGFLDDALTMPPKTEAA